MKQGHCSLDAPPPSPDDSGPLLGIYVSTVTQVTTSLIASDTFHGEIKLCSIHMQTEQCLEEATTVHYLTPHNVRQDALRSLCCVMVAKCWKPPIDNCN
ncbi:hypothetical protein E2C01_088228 [Portunus trituberculatus]|uniref:Uncharacterized protein n=1 Tax=Portunus trituberculatus TaxID=210409 RepID=A0A5B7JIN5_PORTR|nr:hypothetical protein [Portunus trituberculatus]